MPSSIFNRLRNWNSKRKQLAKERDTAIAAIITFSGNEIPGKNLVILGSVAAESDLATTHASTRRSIRLQAHELGANYIINYREEIDSWSVLKCFGDAVVAKDV